MTIFFPSVIASSIFPLRHRGVRGGTLPVSFTNESVTTEQNPALSITMEHSAAKEIKSKHLHSASLNTSPQNIMLLLCH